MFRILKCKKDCYITNKIIKNSIAANSRSINANTGQAGTIDLFKLYNESSNTGSIELSRALLQFDFTPIYFLTSSILNLNDNSFKCYLQLFDVYGGQTTPSNYNLEVYPFAKTFYEGVGKDVIGFQDIDAANWISSSNGVNWNITGSYASGNLGDSNIDYYVSGVLSNVSVSFCKSQFFSSGEEDLNIDVTTLVSGVISGQIPDNGFRLSFSLDEEEDLETRFVKRFSSRHSRNLFKHPKLIVKFNESIIDRQLDLSTDVSCSVGIYNTEFGNYRNFFSSSQEITGSNSLLLELHASKSITTWVSGWSSTHSQSINYLTSSYVYYSSSFSGSLRTGLTGVYYSDIFLDSSDQSFIDCLNSDKSISILPLWKSLDGTRLFSSGSYLKAQLGNGQVENVAERNFVINVQNLKQTYTQLEIGRLRVFIQDYNTDFKAYFVPIETVSKIYNQMYWRLLNANTREIIIPFDTTENGTKLSADGKGMYFDMYFEDLPENHVYEFEFLIRENNQDFVSTNQGFKFKVTK